MKIVVLHWHGVCPHCGKFSCIYVDFFRDGNWVKLQRGFFCDSCKHHITDEEFEKIRLDPCSCPREALE